MALIEEAKTAGAVPSTAGIARFWERYRVDVVVVCLLLGAVAVSFTPVVWLTVVGVLPSDYPGHIPVAERMLQTGTIEAPHFLYHLLVVLVYSIAPGTRFTQAAFIVVMLAYL